MEVLEGETRMNQFPECSPGTAPGMMGHGGSTKVSTDTAGVLVPGTCGVHDGSVDRSRKKKKNRQLMALTTKGRSFGALKGLRAENSRGGQRAAEGGLRRHRHNSQ